jgi:PAS domain S-box-containing protein
MDAMTTSDILNIAIAIGSGGILGVVLKYRVSNRSQKTTEFEKIIKEYKQMNAELKAHLNELEHESDEIKAELSSLKVKLLLFESSHSDLPLPMWMKDRHGRMTYINKFYEAIFLKPRGYELLDCIGKEDSAVWPKDVVERFKVMDMMIISSKAPRRFVEKLAIAEGKEVYLEILKYPRVQNSSVIGINGVVLRISDTPIEISTNI